MHWFWEDPDKKERGYCSGSGLADAEYDCGEGNEGA